MDRGAATKFNNMVHTVHTGTVLNHARNAPYAIHVRAVAGSKMDRAVLVGAVTGFKMNHTVHMQTTPDSMWTVQSI